MSINWVMLDGSSDFVRLPREKVLFTSPPRTSLALQTPNSYPGKEPLSIKYSDGKAVITNQRLIYLPTTSSQQLQSFSSPLLSLQDTHVTAPFFGPNVWEGAFIPTPGGGIPQHHTLVQIKITFREGGAFDFHSTFERIKETVAHAADMARESGRPVANGAEAMDMDLEQLPAYDEVGDGGSIPQPTAEPVPPIIRTNSPEIQRPTPISPNRTVHSPHPANDEQRRAPKPSPPVSEPFPAPDEPPPGYEEVQRISVANDLERRLRNDA